MKSWVMAFPTTSIEKSCAVGVPSEDYSGRTEEVTNKQLEAIQHFVLTLSDQQIISGLAILSLRTPGIAPCLLITFSIVVALSCFSSTTYHMGMMSEKRGRLARSLSWLSIWFRANYSRARARGCSIKVS